MSFAEDLMGLRTGSLDFDAFARRHATRFRRWAGYFFERWPQRTLDVDDLVQEALVATWRAVDGWDPERGVTIERYVEYQVGNRIKHEIERILGWPDKRRGFEAVRPLSADTEPGIGRKLAATSSGGLDALDRLVVSEAVETVAEKVGDLGRDVVAGVALGMTLRGIAAHLYDDPEKRQRYGLKTPTRAIWRARTAITKATTALG